MSGNYLRVCLPVADLRKEPADSCRYERDPLQETQVLYNEVLRILDEDSQWYFVEATEQIKIGPTGDAGGYPGWIRKASVVQMRLVPDYDAVVKHVCANATSEPSSEAEVLARLPLGVKLVVAESNTAGDWIKIQWTENLHAWIPAAHVNRHATGSEDRLRENLTCTAKLLIGLPYLWGGRSTCPTEAASHRAQGTGHMAQVSTKNTNSLPPFSFNLYPGSTAGAVYGVDCSGFTNLVYRANLLDIPRDAADQAAVCARITADMLKPADLIFVSAQECPDQIVHVMFSLGGEEFIEAVETGSFVRRCTFKDKYGLDTRDLSEKQWRVNGRQFSFGSILKQRTTK